jgi:hypothetical protein
VITLEPPGGPFASPPLPHAGSVSCFDSPSVAEGGIRVLVQEVPKRRDELPSMRNIVLPNGRTEVIHQHVPDLFASALALEQATSQHNRDSFGNVLVFGNGVNLIRREITEADQVFKGEHESLRRHGHQRRLLRAVPDY